MNAESQLEALAGAEGRGTDAKTVAPLTAPER
jgi:hypothetical protein